MAPPTYTRLHTASYGSGAFALTASLSSTSNPSPGTTGLLALPVPTSLLVDVAHCWLPVHHAAHSNRVFNPRARLSALAGTVTFTEQPNNQTLVQLSFSNAIPNLLLDLKVGVFGVQNSLRPVLSDNMVAFRSLAEAAAEAEREGRPGGAEAALPPRQEPGPRYWELFDEEKDILVGGRAGAGCGAGGGAARRKRAGRGARRGTGLVPEHGAVCTVALGKYQAMQGTGRVLHVWPAYSLSAENCGTRSAWYLLLLGADVSPHALLTRASNCRRPWTRSTSTRGRRRCGSCGKCTRRASGARGRRRRRRGARRGRGRLTAAPAPQGLAAGRGRIRGSRARAPRLTDRRRPRRLGRRQGQQGGKGLRGRPQRAGRGRRRQGVHGDRRPRALGWPVRRRLGQPRPQSGDQPSPRASRNAVDVSWVGAWQIGRRRRRYGGRGNWLWHQRLLPVGGIVLRQRWARATGIPACLLP